jgi:hypothetical protein
MALDVAGVDVWTKYPVGIVPPEGSAVTVALEWKGP